MTFESVTYTFQMGALVVPVLALLGSLVFSKDQTKLRFIAVGQITAFICSLLALVDLQYLHPHEVSLVGDLVMLRFDTLASAMAVVITGISLIVGFYAERALVGEKKCVKFIQHMVCLAIVANWFVASNSLELSLCGWFGISVLLWRLVGMRSKASDSARTVLYLHFTSDMLFAAAVFLIIGLCQTATLSDLPSHIWQLQSNLVVFGQSLPFDGQVLIGLLLVGAMMIKTSLFPFHRWLLSALDAPTPLSALLHAGVVNISAILYFKMDPILDGAIAARFVLGSFGLLSIIVGTLVCSTQSAVKTKLVWSTIAQMGFTLALCSVGGVAYAVFHLMAHALFKSHLFLRSGSATSEGTLKRKWGYENSSDTMSFGAMISAGAILLASIPLILWLAMDPSAASKSALFALIVAGVVTPALPAFKRIGGGLLLLGGLSYLGAVALSRVVALHYENAMPPASVRTNVFWSAIAVFLASLAVAMHLLRHTRAMKALYVHSLSGFYIDELIAAWHAKRAVKASRVHATRKLSKSGG